MDTTPSVSPLRLLDDRATRLFVALAGLMLSTRKIDWYRLGKQSDATAEKA